MFKKRLDRVIFIFLISLLIFNSPWESAFPNEDTYPVRPDSSNTPEYAPDEIIVKFKQYIPEKDMDISDYAEERDAFLDEQLSLESIEALKEKYGIAEIARIFKDSGLGQEEGEISKALDKAFPGFEEKFKGGQETFSQISKIDLTNIQQFKLAKGSDVLSAAREFAKDPSVEYAEPNYVVHIDMFPNDPYYRSSGSWKQSYDDLWGIKKIQCENAWDISQGEGVVVAVVDTGADYNHEDVAENIWINEYEIPNNKIDDDGNRYIDDVRGWDFTGRDNNPMDGHGHGTHVSGTIAAAGNNNKGVIGVAPEAKVMVIKGLNDSGSGNIADLANCIIYAADNGAKVINNSWGGFGTSSLITDAVNYAHDIKGCVVVAASGNSAINVKYQLPANIPNVIAVAATDPNDTRAAFSNFGAKIDVYAPGVEILSLRASETDMYGNKSHIVGNKYYRSNGTSMAAPHVSGVAALLLASKPKLTNEDVRRILNKSADSIKDSAGRLNANKAVQASQLPLPNQPPVARIDIYKIQRQAPLRVIFSGYSSRDPDGRIVAYDWDFGDGAAHTKTGITSHTYTTANTYTARLIVTDNKGLTGTATVTITVKAPSSSRR